MIVLSLVASLALQVAGSPPCWLVRKAAASLTQEQIKIYTDKMTPEQIRSAKRCLKPEKT